MTIKEAISWFQNKNPGFLVVGYWEKQNGYVLNTKPVPALRNVTQPSQFVVTNDKKIYGTNPIVDDLDQSDMIKLFK